MGDDASIFGWKRKDASYGLSPSKDEQGTILSVFANLIYLQSDSGEVYIYRMEYNANGHLIMALHAIVPIPGTIVGNHLPFEAETPFSQLQSAAMFFNTVWKKQPSERSTNGLYIFSNGQWLWRLNNKIIAHGERITVIPTGEGRSNGDLMLHQTGRKLRPLYMQVTINTQGVISLSNGSTTPEVYELEGRHTVPRGKILPVVQLAQTCAQTARKIGKSK